MVCVGFLFYTSNCSFCPIQLVFCSTLPIVVFCSNGLCYMIDCDRICILPYISLPSSLLYLKLMSKFV